jgi:hypothetical protein
MSSRILIAGIAALLMATSAMPAKTECFTRVYDKAHLAKHPDELVTAVKLHIYHPLPDEARDAT